MSLRPFRIISGLLMACCLALFGCEKEAEEKKQVVRPVRYQQIFLGNVTRVRTFSGVSQAGIESNLSFKVAGNIRKILVKVGDHVKAGQVIAEIDLSEYQLRLQEAEAVFTQARALERNAKAQYARIRELYENGNASRNDLDAARAQAESSSATVSAGIQRRDLARLQVEYASLRAPSEGSIASVTASQNENVKAGQTIAMLTAGRRPEVKVSIPESLIASISKGMQARIKFDAVDGKVFTGAVVETGVATSDSSTTFPITLRLIESAPGVRSGMTAEIEFTFKAKDQSRIVVIPSHAVSEDRQGRYIYVLSLRKDNLAEVNRRGVVVGKLMDNGLEILSGLIDGELVVTAGVSKIVDGQTVKVLGSPSKL